jgi:myo-inositol-1(or 4)-monophosphatase
MELERICREVCNLARETGRYIREEGTQFHRGLVEEKGLHDFVSYVDKQSEEMLVRKLRDIIPGCGFIAEEGTAQSEAELFKWIIDPLDGTTNFIHGLPPYSISIALMRETTLVMGVIYEISLDECFYAWEGSPAFLNENLIQTSDTPTLHQSLIATGFPYTDFNRLEKFMPTLSYFMKHSHGLRRLGSAAVDMAYVACGRFDAFYEYGLNAWDVAAGAFLVKQAGGNVTDFRGGEDYLFGREIVAGNKLIFKEFHDAVSGFMNDQESMTGR